MDSKIKKVNRRFIEAIDELLQKGVFKNATDCANKLGTRATKIAQIRRYEGEVTKSIVHEIMKFGVSPNYLFGYEDSDGLPLNITLLPDKVFAGNTIDISSLSKDSNFQRFRLPKIEGQHFAFEISGESMEPTLSHGNYVICKRIEAITDIVDGDIYVFGLNLNKVKRVEKEYLKGKITGLRLISDNPDPVYRVEKYSIYAFESRILPTFHVIKKISIEDVEKLLK